MYVLFIILFVAGIRAQAQLPNQCACSCCLGQSCPAVIVGVISVQNCTVDLCLAQCRCTYPQCAANSPYGQLMVQCTNPTYAFTCQCLCCSTGSATCTPMFVGYTTAYQCQISSCSIACANQYPGQCVANNYGQTQGSCVGPVTTTTPITTIAPWLGNLCSCSYCQSGYTCTSNVLVGVSSVSQCSSPDCTIACQNRYPTTCSTAYLNQINGVCLATANARTRCKCNCCGTYGCVDYDLTTNDTCASCYSRCTQVAPCGANSRPATYTCTANQPKITADLILSILLLILIFVVNFSS